MNYLGGAIRLIVAHKILVLFIASYLPAISSELRKPKFSLLKEKKNITIACRVLSASAYGLFFLLFSSVLYQSIFGNPPNTDACICILIYLTVNGVGNTIIESWARNHYFKGTRPENDYFCRHYDKIIKDLLEK